MKNYTVILFLLLSFQSLIGEEKRDFSSSLIKDELKENANAVVRFHEEIFSINSFGSATLKIKKVITVLNKNGDDFSELILFYDKHRKIRNLYASIYDKNNKLIKNVRRNEIKDYSAVSGYSLYDDNRVKYIKPIINSYPYTVIYEYIVTYNGLLHYPTWFPQHSYDLSVEKAIFLIKVQKKVNFRYKEKNIANEVIIVDDTPNKVYKWEVSNLPALEEEPYDTKLTERVPVVFSAPNEFKFEDYKGNFESWNNFGKWINQLNKGKDTLSLETQSHLINLTKDANSKIEKIRILYDYLQNKTRYVSIQVGIGGWQPFPATTVDKVSYGDCKALSNYTKAILNAVGIKSYYTLVKAGRNIDNIRSAFPSNQFNHAILCVPLENDTIWLECTSQTNPFGYIGGFTDDRDVLLITEDGGKLAHTTVYNQEINTQHRTAEVNIDPDGNSSAKIKTIYTALQYDNISGILYDSPEDQKKWLYDDIDIPGFKINSFNIINNKTRIPNAELSLDLQLQNYASLSGTRMFIPINLMNKRTYLPKKVDDRKTDVVYRSAFIDIDTIKYTIPTGYIVEYLPENLEVNSEFGDYFITTKMLDNTITYVRNIKMNKGTYPASSYEDFRQFLKKIVNADKMKIVLVKKEV